ncbi:hypothetical protein EDC01DRAFT_612662 [Geopyxis carbonaria]|nr:hypothetical protein EDC01DRAFT_612662 [Geopyxis carbonaria]
MFGEPYDPCSKPVEELKRTFIKDLLMERHHRGTYLIVRTVTPPKKMTGITTVVQDEYGHGHMLSIYNMHPSISPEILLPRGQRLIIKEPYFSTIERGPLTLRVDHISDIVFVDPHNRLVPRRFWPLPALVAKRSLWWKLEGNMSFEAGDFADAIERYTEALKTSKEACLYNDRAQAYLELGYHEKALADAKVAIKMSSQDQTGLNHASVALYNAGKWRDSSAVLRKLLTINPGCGLGKARLKMVIDRLKENQTGNYPFKAMNRSVRLDKVTRLDHADFVGSVRKGVPASNTPERKDGLWATKDIAPGELLICSKAFSIHSQNPDNIFCRSINVKAGVVSCGPAAMFRANLTHYLQNNPEKASEFWNLYSRQYKGVRNKTADGKPVIDNFLLEEIRVWNACTSDLLTADAFAQFCLNLDCQENLIEPKLPAADFKPGYGIWILSSHMNHSCWPNSYISYIGDFQIVRACRPILSGEEITRGFGLATSNNYENRQEYSKDKYGIGCKCNICTLESSETKEVRDRRFVICDKLRQMFTPGSTIRIKMQDVVTLLKDLEGSYTRPPYVQPRHVFAEAWKSLSNYYIEVNKISKIERSNSPTIKTMEQSLRSLAFDWTWDNDEQLRMIRWGFVCSTAFEACLNIAMSWEVVCQKQKAAEWRRITKLIFKIICGEDDSFVRLFGHLTEPITGLGCEN